MKTKFLTFICAVSLTFVSCGGNDSPSEEMIFDPDVNTNKTQVDESIIFTDYSTGVSSRLWTFPGGTPATSTEEEVSVSFSEEGPIVCKVDVTFEDGFTESKNFAIRVGSELYAKSIFGFENESEALNAWKIWVSDDSNAVAFSLENSLGGGANETNGFAKIVISTPNVEAQLFTKDNVDPFNGILESNKTYEFSFWVKSDEFTKFTAASAANQTETQAWHNFAWYSPVKEITNEWSFKTITFETGDLTQIYSEGTANNTYTQFKFVQETTGTLYIDEVSLKEVQ
tara:strand:- start:275 stop:1129 length:855 start_codon:yes stop_codon:yes gene_type:complete